MVPRPHVAAGELVDLVSKVYAVMSTGAGQRVSLGTSSACDVEVPAGAGEKLFVAGAELSVAGAEQPHSAATATRAGRRIT